jgi:hypothetical protein
MNSKEKAIQLVQKFKENQYGGCILCNEDYNDINDSAKQCALLCMEEILDGYRKILPSSRVYWEQVKTEIEKL